MEEGLSGFPTKPVQAETLLQTIDRIHGTAP